MIRISQADTAGVPTDLAKIPNGRAVLNGALVAHVEFDSIKYDPLNSLDRRECAASNQPDFGQLQEEGLAPDCTSKRLIAPMPGGKRSTAANAVPVGPTTLITIHIKLSEILSKDWGTPQSYARILVKLREERP